MILEYLKRANYKYFIYSLINFRDRWASSQISEKRQNVQPEILRGNSSYRTSNAVVSSLPGESSTVTRYPNDFYWSGKTESSLLL